MARVGQELPESVGKEWTMPEWEEVTKAAPVAFVEAARSIANTLFVRNYSIRAFRKGGDIPYQGFAGRFNDTQFRFEGELLDGRKVTFMRVNFSGSTRPLELAIGDVRVRVKNLDLDSIQDGIHRALLLCANKKN